MSSRKIDVLIRKQSLQYLFFGAIAAVTELATFIILVSSFSTYASAVISFLFGLIMSFIFNKFFVFKSSKGAHFELFPFILLGLANSQVSGFLTSYLSTIVGYPLLAKVISMAAIAVFSYTIMKYAIFKK